MRKLYRFHGGIKLEDFKDQSTTQAIEPAPIPKHLVLPLQQHLGESAQAIVAVGEKVCKGQTIAQARGKVSANVHASSSGTVLAIEDRPATHPSGLPAPAIIIETDGCDTWMTHAPGLGDDYATHSPADIRQRVAAAGIVGLGGAGFPTAIKLSPLDDKAVDTLILNGAECEPFISCDDMLMRERADQVVQGGLIMAHALHARHVIIAIEDNKPHALETIRAAAAGLHKGAVEICAVPSL